MEGYLSFHLFSLKFVRLILEFADALCQNFLEPHMLANLHENIVTFFNVTKPKSSHPYLSQRSIVEDLVSDILQVNDVTNVSFHEQIFSLSIPIVNSMVIN